jgi:hypothetical protein
VEYQVEELKKLVWALINSELELDIDEIIHLKKLVLMINEDDLTKAFCDRALKVVDKSNYCWYFADKLGITGIKIGWPKNLQIPIEGLELEVIRKCISSLGSDDWARIGVVRGYLCRCSISKCYSDTVVELKRLFSKKIKEIADYWSDYK